MRKAVITTMKGGNGMEKEFYLLEFTGSE